MTLIIDTNKEEKKFIHDAKVLADELVSDNGAMAHVKDLLNIWAVFSPSKHVRSICARQHHCLC